MTLKDQDRQILINHRINKADELSVEIQIHITNRHSFHYDVLKFKF